MTADRDALAKLVQQAINDSWVSPVDIADAILAAGWRPPEPVHRHDWQSAGFLTVVTGHPAAPYWSCACGALLYGTANALVR